MSAIAPSISTLTPAHYAETKVADIRYRSNGLLPPTFNKDPTTFCTRQFHGCVLLPHQDQAASPIKIGDVIDIEMKFYNQGTSIGLFAATISLLQLISTSRRDTQGDEWSPYSGAHDHSSVNKSMYFIVLEASFPSFEVEILWIQLLSYHEIGFPAFIHPFSFSMDGEALLLYSVQFPQGLNPYILLQLGERLTKTIIQVLTSAAWIPPSELHHLSSNLFVLLTPALGKTMGGHRLAILSADDISENIKKALPSLKHRLPAWEGSPLLNGSIPLGETVIDVGGHLPSTTIMRDPDYLRPTLATYFLEHKEIPSQDIKDTVIMAIKQFFVTDEGPKWHFSERFPTSKGVIHVVISQLPETFSPNASRSNLINLQIEGEIVPCIQVLLRADIAYQFHLPIVTLGGLYNHLPLGGCTSPSTAMLSYYTGHVPMEALYLLTIPDCAAASAILLTNPFVPDAPKLNTHVLEAPKRKGRPPVHRPIKTKANSPPTSLATPVGRPPKSSPPSSTTSTSSNSSDASIIECLRTLSAQVQVLNVRLNAIESHRPPVSRKPVHLEDNFRTIGNLLSLLAIHQPTKIYPQELLHLLVIHQMTWIWNLQLPNAVPLMTLPKAPIRLLKAVITFISNDALLVHHPTCITSIKRKLLITLINFLNTNSSALHSTPLGYRTNKSKHLHLHPPPPLYMLKLVAAKLLPHNFTCQIQQAQDNTTQDNSTKRVNPQFNQIKSNNTTTFSIKFNTKTAFYKYQNNNALTLYHLIHIYTETHHPLPHTCRLSYNNKTVPLHTPLHLFAHHHFPTFNILLPILGGMHADCSPSPHIQTQQNECTPQNTSPTNPCTQINTTNKHSRKLTQQIINRKHFTIRVATLNCNGAPKKANTNENNLIWQFVNQCKIDVLFLIDHRSSNRTLEYLRQSGERYLNTDIRLINSEITLLHSQNNRQGPDTSYHATVGGCAILSFGSLAHITFPTNFTDPSGGNTFIGAKLQYDTSYPPIFLNAIYLFPPSPGPTTLATRISKYLASIHNKQSPCLCQREVIQTLLQNQHDEHPNCVQIVGGDFNHQNWWV